ncbi:MAG: MlaA family lipoprotein [Thermodesulfobacteriota bacterium]
MPEKEEGGKDMFRIRALIGTLIVLIAFVCLAPAKEDRAFSITWGGLVRAAETDVLDDEFDDEFAREEIVVSDPLEPVNRVFFHFNDKLYFWALKPLARVYGTFIPEDFRICIRNAFHNVLFPVRFANNILQGKFANAGIEFSRFCINTTVGVAGLGDPARDVFHLERKDEDFGQTLGFWGIANGLYFCWPILGPSTLRDTAGFVGDSYLNPLAIVMEHDPEGGLALSGGERINSTSLVLGDYESFKESSFDPYISLRDAYVQHRRSKIADNGGKDSLY